MDNRAAQIANTEKAQHGRDAKINLYSLLMLCLRHKYIANPPIPDYRTGIKGYNPTQFYAAYKIDFYDSDSWIIYSTTSMKTDRVKEPLWDAYNIKNINSSVKKAYIVYPDSLEDDKKAPFIVQNKKYVDRLEFSSIDGVISQHDLYTLIEKKAIGNLNPGQITDLVGRNFESQIIEILSSEDNFRKWKTADPLRVGMMYDLYSYIVNRLHPDKSTVVKISATRDKDILGILPSGGKPKTDVLVTFTLDNMSKLQFTISCKHPQTRSKNVTVHDYTADAFADVLDKNNTQLRKMLNAFQTTPTLQDFGKNNVLALHKLLYPYNEKLTRWVLSGQGGQGNPIQIATHILTYRADTHTAFLYTIEEYCTELIKAGVHGHFGTLFTWTYPSGQRGKRIQLKCRIV